MKSVRSLVSILVAGALFAGLTVALFYSGDRSGDRDFAAADASVAVDDRDPEAENVASVDGELRSDIGFRAASEYDTGGEPFADEVVDEITATLDGLLARPETVEDFESQAGLHLWRYATRLASGYLTPEQEARVIAQLDGLIADHPDNAELFESTRFMVSNLMLGRVAPNIVGKDLEGAELELADYRGKVVAIVFTGQWCGPCRSEYPYQRLLLEVMDEEDFVLLGVNSDADVEVAKQAKIDERLDYRAWWDGHAEESTSGPIATTWNVTGWPTVYVLDENGVIRRRGTRHEKLITAAKELVAEMKRRRPAEQ